ncbi:hypothetical protein SASPL_134157 [Salvia splendens]|uniref:Carboxypeptidase n=1 Tax=Salvia splendens TaxID=180675 RepID=A0A8X8X4D5_SALSN|nr:hypothetical protein SASPL_134157 [Salvia splendens]
MKGGVIIFLISVVCLFASVQCKNRDPLRELLKSHKKRRSEASAVVEDASTEYSPVYMLPQDGLKEEDKITGLPGQPPVTFPQYSGYVTVDPTAGRALFYWLTEADDSSNKPLVLTRVFLDRKWRDDRAWAVPCERRRKDVVSPAGVGFSYSNTTSDYVTGDTKTAADSYTFLVNWLERFPEYKTRDFYITGESYAGHYVPQLAQLILKNNKVTNQSVINLKGIAIGNAYIDYLDEINGSYDYYWSHALISDESHDGIIKYCNFSAPEISDKCEQALDQADDEIGNIFGYDIYAPLCSSNSTAPSLSSFDPCSSDYVFTYLNTPEVQQALHANISGALPGPWDACSNLISWTEEPETVLPVIKELMASGISVWIYSGDTDGVVPVTTTRYSLPKLSNTIKTPWYPWYYQGEVGGYVVGYENVTFVTIRGAGHFVPSYQPERAIAFFSSFLEGKLPPSS